jgi:hypothetical protein
MSYNKQKDAEEVGPGALAAALKYGRRVLSTSFPWHSLSLATIRQCHCTRFFNISCISLSLTSSSNPSPYATI